MHSQQPPGVVQNRSTLQCSKQNTEQCGYDHAPVTRGRMRAQFPLPHGPVELSPLAQGSLCIYPFGYDPAHFATKKCVNMTCLPPSPKRKHSPSPEIDANTWSLCLDKAVHAHEPEGGVYVGYSISSHGS